MNLGQPKPGYNVQIFTFNQFIVDFTIHLDPTDNGTLPVHLDQHEHNYVSYTDNVTADAGYRSEENYNFWRTKKQQFISNTHNSIKSK